MKFELDLFFFANALSEGLLKRPVHTTPGKFLARGELLLNFGRNEVFEPNHWFEEVYAGFDCERDFQIAKLVSFLF